MPGDTITFGPLHALRKVTGTTNGTDGTTQVSVAHKLGRKPDIVLLVPTADASLYLSATEDATNVYVKARDAASTSKAFTVWVG